MEAIAALDDILTRMQPHQHKKPDDAAATALYQAGHGQQADESALDLPKDRQHLIWINLS